MVEMTETANILHNATEYSLVLMDDLNEGVFGRRAPSMENGIRYVSMSHEVVTGEPIHVRTEKELRETMHSGVLVVDDHITLTEGLDVG